MDELEAALSDMTVGIKYRFIRNPSIFDFTPILSENHITLICSQMKWSLVKRELPDNINEFTISGDSFSMEVVVHSMPLESECGRNWHMKYPEFID